MAHSVRPDQSTTIDGIVELIKTLRSEKGCPWDKKQTPDTMARYLMEEVYELVDAIITKDAEAVCEETGDVLFQLLFVVNLFSESGYFNLEDVVKKNVEKMVRRHPHVFGDVTATTPEMVRENWDQIKRTEKKENVSASVLSSIPQGIPALLRAYMVSERAARTGFDWDDISGVMEKTMEEWAEFSTEVDNPPAGASDNDKAEMEFGDVLFTMVNVARFARIHPEMALVRAIQKFEKRFRYMEEKAVSIGIDVSDLTFQEKHRLWDEAKGGVD